MNKLFTPYEQSLDMKSIGFDEPCLGYWRNEDLPNPLTLGQYTTKEDMEYEIGKLSFIQTCVYVFFPSIIIRRVSGRYKRYEDFMKEFDKLSTTKKQPCGS